MNAAPPDQRPSRPALALRTFGAWAAMGIGLGVAGPVSMAIADQTGFGRTARQAVGAVVVSLIVVSVVLWLHARLDRRPYAALGFVSAVSAVRTFGLGVAVTGGAAAVAIVPAVLGGWIAFGSVDWGALAGFLVVNACIAFALEALPEELTFRGYIYATLKRRGARRAPFFVTTALFCLIMLPTSAAAAAATMLLGGDPDGVAFAPSGQEPVTYVLLLACFGTALLAARIATGSLWTSMALHLTFLTVNRIVFAGEGRDTGVRVESAPDAAVLVLAYLVLTAAAFGVLARVRGRRGGQVDPSRRPSAVGPASTSP
ncbi:CPBP family intramembrane glutamic endopeptidase [Glycomyces tritici]|uniref:CPBP family intramembrane metalloprotease n=1 Tax=Glycomyces tritici TaxID=2665176 RepID=A0ABT7YN14_9ACTN|nr:CPBP family intramembrane glutamic endopeptidase [Glycomyces tritici]MDN3240011.1 CPBP family intramembrane metalloprotease [Glycomyces tritici]